MDIHTNAKRRLIDATAKALPLIEVEHGKYIRRLSAFVALQEAEAALPTTGKLREMIDTYIDYDFAFSEFVIDSLSDELRDQNYITEESPKKLTEIAGCEDSEQLAKRLVESFAALPRKYTLSVNLPVELSPMLPADKWKIKLSPILRMARGGAELTEAYPVKDAKPALGFGLLGGLLSNSMNWQEGTLYLQIETSGFIGIYGGSTPHLEALRTIRSFCGLGLALRLFDMKREYSLRPLPRLTMNVHQLVEDKWSPIQTLDLSDTLSAGIRSLRLNTVDGWITDEMRQVSWANAQLKTIGAAFAQGKKPETIQLAAQWFFDGNREGADELLRFVQMMIVLEILLGDKNMSDQMGLNELLRNRCAYLIGSSNEKRSELLDLFSRIYTVRSQIVHRGKHRLNMEERGLFSRLQWMCRRVISKELELLVADEKK